MTHSPQINNMDSNISIPIKRDDLKDPPDEHKMQKTLKKQENRDFLKIRDFYTFLELKKGRFPLQLQTDAEKKLGACGG
jgi:hypothetical protein